MKHEAEKKPAKKNYARRANPASLARIQETLAQPVRETQERAVTVKYRKELLRQKYISARGPISVKEFDEFMTTPEYAEFLLEQREPGNATRLSA